MLGVYLSPPSTSFEELRVMPTSLVLFRLSSDLFRLLLPQVPLAQLLLSLQPLQLTVLQQPMPQLLRLFSFSLLLPACS